jgi:hypothetical protein
MNHCKVSLLPFALAISRQAEVVQGSARQQGRPKHLGVRLWCLDFMRLGQGEGFFENFGHDLVRSRGAGGNAYGLATWR